MNAEGGERKVLYELRSPEPCGVNTCPTISRPVWSPQGDRIAFSVGAHMGAPGPTHLALIRPDGSDVTMLTSGERHDGLPSWSPDGTRLVFRTVTGSRTGLSIIDIDRGAITPLPTGSDYDTFPAWSPRGDLISFTSKRDDDYEIYVIRPDGSGLRRLTHTRGNDAHSEWSPDGEWIAFSTSRHGFKDEFALSLGSPQPYGEICVMRPDGSDVRVFPLALLGWVAGCMAIWSALFAEGNYLYGRMPEAIFLTGVLIVSGAVLVFAVRRTWASLAHLSNVKMSLGFVNSVGEQKGVDSLIVTDMIALARNRAISDAVLISGDEDLRVGVQQAQEFGVRVHLVGIKPSRGSQSLFLLQESDTTHEWSEHEVAGFLSVRERTVATAPAGEPGPALQAAQGDPLELIATEIANSIDPSELEAVLEAVDSSRQIPREIDRQLLAGGRTRLGRDLLPEIRSVCSGRDGRLDDCGAERLRAAVPGFLPARRRRHRPRLRHGADRPPARDHR